MGLGWCLGHPCFCTEVNSTLFYYKDPHHSMAFWTTFGNKWEFNQIFKGHIQPSCNQSNSIAFRRTVSAYSRVEIDPQHPAHPIGGGGCPWNVVQPELPSPWSVSCPCWFMFISIRDPYWIMGSSGQICSSCESLLLYWNYIDLHQLKIWLVTFLVPKCVFSKAFDIILKSVTKRV